MTLAGRWGRLMSWPLPCPLGFASPPAWWRQVSITSSSCPANCPGLTVSFAGQLLRTSMRVRQEVAELATRGDELLAPLIGGAEEHPAWATFDEDEDESRRPDDGRRTAATPLGGWRSGRDHAGGRHRWSTGGASIGGPILVSGAEHAGAEIPDSTSSRRRPRGGQRRRVAGRVCRRTRRRRTRRRRWSEAWGGGRRQALPQPGKVRQRSTPTISSTSPRMPRRRRRAGVQHQQ